jgi:hypothetical protein
MEPTIVQFTVGLTPPDEVRLRADYELKLDRCVSNLGYIERVSSATIHRVAE